jgi:hypothetical protein
MTQKVICSAWSADAFPLVERAAVALKAVAGKFPETTYWKVGPSASQGPGDRIILEEKDDIRKYGGKIGDIWKNSIKQLSGQGIPVDDLVVNSSVYSVKMGFSVRVFFDDFQLSVETEPEYTARALSSYLGEMVSIMKEIVEEPVIGACWLRGYSAFAGDPVYMYEPKKPCAALWDPLTYDEVTEEVKSLRRRVCSLLKVDDFERLLVDLDIEVHRLSGDRIFVQLGDPAKKDGKTLVAKLTRQIDKILKNAGY